jgi:hypothetical protein
MSSYGGSFTGGSVLPYDGSIIVSTAAQAVRLTVSWKAFTDE